MGATDEWGCVPECGIPGKTLSQLFGVVEVDVNSENHKVVSGAKIPTGFQYQELELLDEDTNVLARMEDGFPAIVEHKYGKGKTIYFNSFEGLVLLEELYPELQDLILNAVPCLKDVCVHKAPFVHLSFMENDNKKMLLAINFAQQDETIRFEEFAPGAKLFELFTQQEVTLNENAEIVLPANSHSIFLFE